MSNKVAAMPERGAAQLQPSENIARSRAQRGARRAPLGRDLDRLPATPVRLTAPMSGLYGDRNADSILDAGYIADMTDVIRTGLLTLAGALGGSVVPALRRETSTETLVEARRSVVRAELSTLIAEVCAHLESATLFMMLIGKGTDQDLMEFVNTDSGREAQRRTAAIYRSLAGLTVTVGDPPVLNALVELEECINDWADKANGPVSAAKSAAGTSSTP